MSAMLDADAAKALSVTAAAMLSALPTAADASTAAAAAASASAVGAMGKGGDCCAITFTEEDGRTSLSSSSA